MGLTVKTAQADVDLEQRFEALKSEWVRETRFCSISAQRISHPAYLRMVQLGEAAVPLILRELQRKPDFWFAALEAITKENPVAPEHLGDVRAMSHDWVDWGREHGYVF